jgi:hypothetical protein
MGHLLQFDPDAGISSGHAGQGQGVVRAVELR